MVWWQQRGHSSSGTCPCPGKREQNGNRDWGYGVQRGAAGHALPSHPMELLPRTPQPAEPFPVLPVSPSLLRCPPSQVAALTAGS